MSATWGMWLNFCCIGVYCYARVHLGCTWKRYINSYNCQLFWTTYNALLQGSGNLVFSSSGFPENGEPNGRVCYRELISFKKVSDGVTLLIEFFALRHAKGRKEFHFSEHLVFVRRRKRCWEVSKVNVSSRAAHLSKTLYNKRVKTVPVLTVKTYRWQ